MLTDHEKLAACGATYFGRNSIGCVLPDGEVQFCPYGMLLAVRGVRIEVQNDFVFYVFQGVDFASIREDVAAAFGFTGLTAWGDYLDALASEGERILDRLRWG